MKRRLKTRIFLVIAISFLLPFLSAYMNYCVLIEADFLTVYPQFENADSDSHLLLKKQEFTPLAGFTCTSWGADNPVGYLSNPYFPVTLPQVKNLVLRC